MKKNILFYLGMLFVFGFFVWCVLHKGIGLESEKISLGVLNQVVPPETSRHFLSGLIRNLQQPLGILILQILCIIVTARIFGALMVKIGQPTVVGEIIAGIMLGPSFLGTVFPQASEFIFPAQSLTRLHVLSQIGLILFMFIIGMELDLSILKKRVHAAVIVSHTSIIFPYFLGVLLAYFLYGPFAPPNVHFAAFALFMGIAMSITAFPVLARIVQERNFTNTPLGALVITCAATDDITAWCLLAVVIAIAHAGSIANSLGTIVLAVLYIAFMLYVLKPFLYRFARKYDTFESVSKKIIAVIFSVLFFSSLLTEMIGIHALFGAFVAGIAIPAHQEFRRILAEKIEDISLVILLPLFFVFTGLRTQLGLLNDAHLWSVFFIILGVAVLGKFVGSAVAARFVGQSWRDSLLIGALMNTRGLMELVVLNIGYDLGILSPEIFTMMVLMALTTTFMTGSAINWIERFFPSPEIALRESLSRVGFNPVISFGPPHSGARLLELAYYLNLKNEKDNSITALHFSPSSEISIIEAEKNEREAFSPIRQKAKELGIILKTQFKVSDQVGEEIIRTVKWGQYDMLLVGSSRRLFDHDQIGGKVSNFSRKLNCGVGVFIDKNFRKVDQVLIVMHDIRDLFLLKYGQRYLQGHERNKLTIIDETSSLRVSEYSKILQDQMSYDRIILKEGRQEKLNFFEGHDLVIISFTCWKELKGNQGHWLQEIPSVLIINK